MLHGPSNQISSSCKPELANWSDAFVILVVCLGVTAETEKSEHPRPAVPTRDWEGDES